MRCINSNFRDGWVVVGTNTFNKEAESGNLPIDSFTTLPKHSFVSGVIAEHLPSQTPEQADVHNIATLHVITEESRITFFDYSGKQRSMKRGKATGNCGRRANDKISNSDS